MSSIDQPEWTGSGFPGASGPDPLSAEMGERIREAWEAGTLVLPLRRADVPVRLQGMTKRVLPTGLAGPATVDLAGVGERFAVWCVQPEGNGPLAVRIPHVGPDELAQGLAQEMAALTLASAGIGPEPVAFHDDAVTSPLGQPYVCTSYTEGEVLPVRDWSPEHLTAHARRLAHLHEVTAPGRGPLQLADDPLGAVLEDGVPLVEEVREQARVWHERAGQEITSEGLSPFVDAMLARVEAEAALFEELDRSVLVHGDLCATNVLWSPEGGSSAPHDAADPGGPSRPGAPGDPRFIDFEWAQADDPARDLAIIGGTVHGGPWYVPMDTEAVEEFVHAYVDERRALGDRSAACTDVSGILRRMRVWTAYERTAMLVHVARLAPDSRRHREVLPTLRGTLARELDVTL